MDLLKPAVLSAENNGKELATKELSNKRNAELRSNLLKTQCQNIWHSIYYWPLKESKQSITGGDY